MKIKSIAAAGAISAGLGIAGFFAGTGTASAACTDDPIPVGERVGCLTNASLAEFARTTSPAYNIDVFLNGQNEVAGDPTTNNGLGILDQPQTFVDSVGEFLSGPKAPDPAPQSGSGL
ncbi:hypothetical protein [Mycolicibacterium sp. 120270]|uniref:hypothetical protein n=1 Tax=Mycolicibacterium sp. 120270 TaxID=3090600 RepID=UPI00299D91F0|nr:hypothetical protein [Mycolicibacterium sp. 120270]MDX1885090.1 hypothetical protein [Mycolicibacterium sp. 120270]